MSSTAIRLGGKKLSLEAKDLLGQGGEAMVYRHGTLALKLYHPMPAALLEARIQKLRDFPTQLPREVLGPTELVTDPKGKPIGFAMQLLEGAEDARLLAQRRFREGRISNLELLQLFKKLALLLATLHQRQVVVGDLNDGNLVFTGNAAQPWLVDADSMQFGPHLCTVAHERFLDPRLYGLDLASRRAFEPGTDWYAFGVLLFSSLLYVHPFGGVHSAFPTLVRRAEARHSILRGDVAIPKGASRFDVLSDPLLDWFRGTFELDRRDALPESLLSQRFVRCSCGVEHARRVCPACAIRVTGAAEPVVRRGRVRVVSIHRTEGVIVASAIDGGLLHLTLANGELRREDGTLVPLVGIGAPLHELQFRLNARTTWIGHGRQLLGLRAGQPAERAFTGRIGKASVFDASEGSLLVLADEFLVEAQSQRRLGSVLEGQTWFRASPKLGYGLYRAGKLSMHFLFDPRRAGISMLALPAIEGRLLDAHAVFDEDHALVSLLSENGGVAHSAVHFIRRDGKLLGSKLGSPDRSSLLRAPRAKALLGGRILASTDQGLLSVRVEQGELLEGELFTDSEPFTSEDAELHAGPGGSVYVVTAREILQLSLQ